MRRVAVFVIVAALAGLIAVPEATATTVPLPEDATLYVPGHGWGHGRGLGQWGAKGMADGGSSYQQILSHYYSGVTFGARSATEDIRVLVAESASGVVITADSPFTMTWSSGAAIATSDTTYRYWRARWDGTIYHLEKAAGYNGPWSAVATGSTYIWFKPGSSMLQVVASNGSSHYYRGTIFARQIPNAIRAVDVLTMQQYLYGVVPRESPASWPAEELKAQAVAARTYAAYKKDYQRAAGYWYDICTTTSCQSYGGYAWKTSPTATKTVLEYPSSNAAVDATAGVALLYGGKPILAEYSSSTGGYTAPGSVAYQKAVPDPSDSVSPEHDWQAKLHPSDIEAHWPAIGRLVDINVTQRNGYGDWGGRVVQMSLVGTSSTVTVSGDAFRNAFGLRSDWFRPLYYDGAVSSVPSTISVSQGSTTTISVQVRNTGTIWWPVGGVVRLAASDARFYGSDWISTTRAASVAANLTSPSTASVGPGQVALFRIPIHTSGIAPGTYNERFSIVADGSSTMAPAFSVAVQVLTGWTDEAPNLITNGSFESAGTGWKGSGLTKGDGVTSATARDLTHAFAIIGGGAKSLTQTIPLAGGARTFTLGGWSRTVGSSANGGPVELAVTARYVDGTAGTWHLAFPRAQHLWTYAETVIATDVRKSVSSLTVSAVYGQQTGTGYFDAIRLQETPVANASFERGLTGWATGGFGAGDGVVSGGPDGIQALSIAGVAGSKSVSQGLSSLSGTHSERFVLGAWTRAVGTNGSGGPVAATLTFYNLDGTTSTAALTFDATPHNWTYSETLLSAPKSFSHARIGLGVSGQTGTFSFDDVRIARSWDRNSSFEDGLTSWSASGFGTGSGRTLSSARDGAAALVLTGSSKASVVQPIPFGGRAGYRFVLSGWVRTSGTSPAGGFVGYIAVLRNTDGTSTSFALPTATSTHPWSYGEVAVFAPKAFSRVDVYGAFYGQTGAAYFDGVRLRSA